MPLAILFHFLCAQHVSDINISITRSLRLWVVLVLQAEACKTSTTQNQPHEISNTQRTESKTADVVIQQHSRKLLMMDISMSETCWAFKKWNKIASDIKLVCHSSTITIMHGPINFKIAYNLSKGILFVNIVKFLLNLLMSLFSLTGQFSVRNTAAFRLPLSCSSSLQSYSTWSIVCSPSVSAFRWPKLCASCSSMLFVFFCLSSISCM